MRPELTKPFHLALFLPSLAGGGAQRVMLNLARGLLKEGTKVDVVLARAEGPYIKDLPAGARLIDLKGRRMLFAVLPLCRYLRSEKPDAMVSALDYANVAAIIAASAGGTKTKIAVVSHIHLSTGLKQLSFFEREFFRFMLRLTYPRADSVVAVSRGAAEDLAKSILLPISRVSVIYNPVVDQYLLNEARQPVQHPWLQTAGVPVILAVGRLTAAKDFNLLLHAFAFVKRHTEARLVILGEGELRGELQRTVDALGLNDTVDMPGFVSNPLDYMSRSTVVTLSSRWEALPTVLIEAMSLGIPVVSTDCPSGPNEVLGAGKYGRLVPVGDATAMATALLDAIRGNVPPPPQESWQPYLIENATKEYLSLFGIKTKSSIIDHT